MMSMSVLQLAKKMENSKLSKVFKTQYYIIQCRSDGFDESV